MGTPVCRMRFETAAVHKDFCMLGRNNLLGMKKDKKRIELEIYDELIEVNVSKGEEMEYYDAAKFVTDRFEAYTRMYLGTKSQHTISLMTMLDTAVKLMPYNTNKVKGHSFWGKTKNYFRKLWLLVSLTFVRSKRYLSTKITR